jgi:hypothetical protein
MTTCASISIIRLDCILKKSEAGCASRIIQANSRSRQLAMPRRPKGLQLIGDSAIIKLSAVARVRFSSSGLWSYSARKDATHITHSCPEARPLQRFPNCCFFLFIILEKRMPKITLPAERAQELFLDMFNPKYKVTDKFYKDHMIKDENLSSKISKKYAIDRYKENPRITTSSWTAISKEKIINKAANARKKASVYRAEQQMIVELKDVHRRTVRIDSYTRKELQGKKLTDYEAVEVMGETRYLSTSSSEDTVTLCCVGNWKPLNGEIEIYHYEECDLPVAAQMLARYLQWYYREDGGRKVPTNPVAT